MSRDASPLLGQAAAVRAFSRALAGDRVHHAWILHGPMGVGKMLAARLFAALVLDPAATSTHRDAFSPPVDSEEARLLAAGTHPDVTVIRKELARHSANRELRERKQLNIPLDLLRETLIGGTDGEGRVHDSAVFRTASRGHGKVFVIDEAELLEAEAQNALLKTLEEPPPRTYLLLLTTRLDRLLPTIRSRCQQVAFGPLDQTSMQAWLAGGALEATGAEREWILRFAEGSPGAAVSAAKQGLHAWWSDFQRGYQMLDQGRLVGELAERMHERAAELAESIVKENEYASKEAANRLGLSLLARMAGLHLRERLRAACERGAGDETERTLESMRAIERFEENVRGNVNPKLALAALVAEWAQACRPAVIAR
ncbi:MAG: ATP-binding protein [Planctomycetota bacterium]